MFSVFTDAPNFPIPPQKQFRFLSMPNDLQANKRNYYTEIFFQKFTTASYKNVNNPIPADITNIFNNLISFIPDVLTGGGAETSFASSSSTAIRLPIPTKVNDRLTLSWQNQSVLQVAGRTASSLLSRGLSNALNAAGPLAGAGLALAGKALNPLLFQQFNNQNFREFTFEWDLAPKNEQESATVKDIIDIIKGASLPSFGFPFQDYPLIAMVKMYPNNLNNHIIFKPMAVTGISANYTSNGPSFFEETRFTSGAPTVIALTVAFTEIKLWYRNADGKPY